MYNITFQQIEAFLTVAKYLNMSRAAESLYISQPTLSKALQRFEKGIGFEVFLRSNQGVVLTPQGEYLLGALDSLYTNMDKAIKSARDITAKERKLLHVIVPSSFDIVNSYDGIKEIIGEYERVNPEIMLTVQLLDFSELSTQFEFGETDIAFTHEFVAKNMQGVVYKRVAEYPCYLAYSSKSEIAQMDKPDAEVLSKYPVFAVRQSDVNVARENVVRNCQRAGFTPLRVELIDNFQTMLHLIRSNRGISICAKFTGSVADGIEYYYNKNWNVSTHVVLAWYPERLNKLSKEFIKLFPDLDNPENIV